MKLKQLPKDGMWIDESGLSIPYNRTTALERLKEKEAFSIFSDAKVINEKLTTFKIKISEIVEKILDKLREENNVKLEGKGNLTWYNFDRSLKIEVNVNEQIKFDEQLIETAKEILLNLVRENISGDDFIISIVEDAFQTSKGKLDTKKVLGLKKHTARIKNKDLKVEWERAMSVIDKSISRPSSKTYFKVWFKDEDGKYNPIELNFSAI